MKRAYSNFRVKVTFLSASTQIGTAVSITNMTGLL